MASSPEDDDEPLDSRSVTISFGYQICIPHYGGCLPESPIITDASLTGTCLKGIINTIPLGYRTGEIPLFVFNRLKQDCDFASTNGLSYRYNEFSPVRIFLKFKSSFISDVPMSQSSNGSSYSDQLLDVTLGELQEELMYSDVGLEPVLEVITGVRSILLESVSISDS